MRPEDAKRLIEELVKQHRKLIRDLASISSPMRLLAENEPVGDLVLLSLMDDELHSSHLWVYLKFVSDWLRETEERYKSQFPGGTPKAGKRLDLSKRPPGFKSRLEIFKEIAEQAESNKVWDTELIVNDPVCVVKRFRDSWNLPYEEPES
jgi:hypothetical protein